MAAAERLKMNHQQQDDRMLLFCCDIWRLSLKLAAAGLLLSTQSSSSTTTAAAAAVDDDGGGAINTVAASEGAFTLAQCRCSAAKSSGPDSYDHAMRSLQRGDGHKLCKCERQLLFFNLLAPRNGVGALNLLHHSLRRCFVLHCRCNYITRALYTTLCVDA